jgi:hypothetical protein
MPADAPKPPHPTYALTTSELSDWRTELEHAIAQPDFISPVARANLQAKLDEVLAEQEQRDNIRHGRRKGTHSL